MLTQQQKTFCLLVVNGNNLKNSYLKAGYKPADPAAASSLAARLTKNEFVRTEMCRLRAIQQEKALKNFDFIGSATKLLPRTLAVQEEIMERKKSPAYARLTAASTIQDRVLGKARDVQTVTHDVAPGLEDRIRRLKRLLDGSAGRVIDVEVEP